MVSRRTIGSVRKKSRGNEVMAKQQSSVAELYQTDLERHLFTTRSSRSPRQRRSADEITAQLREWWKFGWTRWKEAVATISISF
jgi:hypothetical protein